MNDIEKQLANNANNKTFEYKEGYWNNALATLKAAEAAKRRKGFFWIFFALLLVGGIGTYFAKNLTSIDTEVPTYTERSNNTSGINNNNLNTAQGTNEATTNTKDNSLSSNKVKNYGSNNKTNTTSIASTKPSTNKFSNNNTLGGNTNATTNTTSSTTIANSKPNTGEKSIANNSNSNNSSGSINNIPNNSSARLPLKNTDNTSLNNTSNTIKSNKRAELTFETLTSIELDSNTAKNELALYSGEEEKLEIISREENSNKLSFVINLGTVASRSFNGNKTSFDVPYIGGELYYQINNKFNASIGLAHYQKSGIGYIKNFTSVEYGFGIKETTTVLTFDKIYFIEIPLKVNYALTQNHLIGLGGAYSSIIGSENRLFSSGTENGANGISSFGSEDEQVIGKIAESYSKNSTSLFLSYEFRKDRLGAEIRYHYGLNDITNDQIFEKIQIDRNSRLLFTLKYLLFK